MVNVDKKALKIHIESLQTTVNGTFLKEEQKDEFKKELKLCNDYMEGKIPEKEFIVELAKYG